jgi:ribosomal protein S18 acetylase RimI-like enzyme
VTRSAARGTPGAVQRSTPMKVSGMVPVGNGSYRITVGAGGQEVGSVMVHDRGKAALEVTDLAVDQAYRKQGLGGVLMASAARAGLQLRKSKVTLASQDLGTGRLTAWYKKMGFAPTGANKRGYPVLEAPISRALSGVAQGRLGVVRVPSKLNSAKAAFVFSGSSVRSGPRSAAVQLMKYPLGFESEKQFRDLTRPIAKANRDAQIIVTGSSVTDQSRKGGRFRNSKDQKPSDIDLGIVKQDSVNQGDVDRRGFPLKGTDLAKMEEKYGKGVLKSTGHRSGIKYFNEWPNDQNGNKRDGIVRVHTPELALEEEEKEEAWKRARKKEKEEEEEEKKKKEEEEKKKKTEGRGGRGIARRRRRRRKTRKRNRSGSRREKVGPRNAPRLEAIGQASVRRGFVRDRTPSVP